MHAYVHTYIHTYIRTYVHTHIHQTNFAKSGRKIRDREPRFGGVSLPDENARRQSDDQADTAADLARLQRGVEELERERSRADAEVIRGGGFRSAADVLRYVVHLHRARSRLYRRLR